MSQESSQPIHTDAKRRHDFVLLFDVADGNPNGDPDAGNLPRVDPETMHGLVTDVCLKRKIRNYVQLFAEQEEAPVGLGIYIQDKGIALNTLHSRAYEEEKIKPAAGGKQAPKDVEKVRARMCSTYYDVRMFGAVMTTGVNCGQVRGPVQLTFGRSLDPIMPLDLSITRVAITRESDLQTSGEEGEAGTGKRTEMGRKSLVPYALYRAQGFFSPSFAASTGVDTADLDLLWTALQGMFEIDRSASRGMMSCRGLHVFSHENALGNAPAHRLFARVAARSVEGVEVARSFEDYAVTVDDADLPPGVTLHSFPL